MQEAKKNIYQIDEVFFDEDELIKTVQLDLYCHLHNTKKFFELEERICNQIWIKAAEENSRQAASKGLYWARRSAMLNLL